ncbi:hypothetical protein [Arthrobacter cryoconiti]|uniref:Gram-positive cocci surface proteins LPxTG domain-containing protein n=1 Tax=Arthrobacter cryoconiti TaxID=748907 RepID=A0ABV8QXQ2_9MICC|nr:hypothetical protein [Arthrobacter cryoconiti]MCC9067716.1 hypothetical protein [Arthrobacter cryoconiti]
MAHVEVLGSNTFLQNRARDLATTGASIFPLGLGALVLLGAGVGVAMASRRKTARS